MSTAMLIMPTPAQVRGHTVPSLTPRQYEVLTHIVAGATRREVAATLHLHPDTVKQHIAGILAAYHSPSLVGVLAAMLRDGWPTIREQVVRNDWHTRTM